MILKTVKGRIKARSENVSRERLVKAVIGLEQELAHFFGEGLENKYFRLQAKKVKSKILCKEVLY